MKKTSPVVMSDKQTRSEKLRKSNADRAREAREREERAIAAAIRLGSALGLPTRSEAAR